ncbi:MAG: LacI family transcriptional regulator [Rhodoferax sp.]|nr:LacI family transcriptional regulator [Rhodoferax sp.]
MAKNDRGMVTGDPVTYQIPAPAGGVQMETFIPWTLVKRGVRRQVITPIDAPEQFQREAFVERSASKEAKDSPLIRALGLAHYWHRLLDDGKFRSLSEIANAEGMDLGQVSRTARLTSLSSGIVNACLHEKPGTHTLDNLVRVSRSIAWCEQKDVSTR